MENAVYFFDFVSISIWWKPDIKSGVENFFALPSWSKMWSILGNVNVSAEIFLFSCIKSTNLNSFIILHFLYLSINFVFMCPGSSVVFNVGRDIIISIYYLFVKIIVRIKKLLGIVF